MTPKVEEYIRKDISSHFLATENSPIEGFYLELNLKNEKCFISCCYNSHRLIMNKHFVGLAKF